MQMPSPRAVAERLDDPLACCRREHRLQPAALDHHDAAVGLERDAVAVVEALGDDVERAVGSSTWTRPTGSGGGGWCGGSVKYSVPSAATVRSLGARKPVVGAGSGRVPSGATCCRPGVAGRYGGGSAIQARDSRSRCRRSA